MSLHCDSVLHLEHRSLAEVFPHFIFFNKMLLRSIKIKQKVQRNSMTHCEWPESMFHKSIKITCRKLKANINKKPERSNVLFLDFSTNMYCAS